MMQIDKKYIKTRFWKLYARFLSYVFFEGRPLTTRGRWINPIVFANYNLAKILPQFKRVKKPIFILGTGRSGTTILGIVMSMHKNVGFLNEPKALWHAVNPHEDLIGSYTMDRASYFLDDSNVTEKQKKEIHKILGLYLFMTGSRVVVDKYPELIFRVPYVKTLFPDAKFLFLVRNGWDTCASIDKWSDRLSTSNDKETQDWWGRNNRKWYLLIEQVIKKDDYFKDIVPVLSEIKKHTDMAAIEWISTMRQGLSVVEKYPNSILRVNYEILVKEPVKVLKDIQQFCGLEEDDVFIEYGKKTLKGVKPKGAFDMHPAILPLFTETMNKLGYII
jgi:hypothetical protein